MTSSPEPKTTPVQDTAIPVRGASAKPLSIGRTIVAVLWSFLGVRKNDAFQEDIGKLNPLVIIAVGVMATFVLIALLYGIAMWAVRQPTGIT